MTTGPARGAMRCGPGPWMVMVMVVIDQ